MGGKRLLRGEPCDKCGEEHVKCLSHSKRTKKQCMNSCMTNQDVCYHHGGNKVAAKANAAARGLEKEAREVIEKRWQANGSEPIVDPLAELARIAGEIVAWKDYLAGKTRELDGHLAYWVDRDFIGPDGEVARSEAAEQLRAIVRAYERAQDRAAKVLADMVKLDIAGRLADVRESQAALVVAAVRAGLALVTLDADTRTAVLDAVANQLALISVPDTIPQELQ